MKIQRLIFIVCLFTQYIYADPPKSAPLFNNLGTTHHAITTSKPLAQRYFDQGLVLFYGFEWAEAVRSFKEATRLDPHCGMCYWGLALSLGSKANTLMNGHEYVDAQQAIQKALQLKQYETPKEQTYIQALALRFQHAPKKSKTTMFNCHISGWQEISTPSELMDYANALKKLTEQYPQDLDAQALYAYAFFDVTGWHFYDEYQLANTYTPTIIKTLEDILKKDKYHVGANHYYVHVIEQSPHPENAMTSADLLQTLVPGSQHLVHMPTHIYFLTGHYHEASQSNLAAIAAYKNYSKLAREQGFAPEPTFLYQHNFDFLRTTAAMEGRQQLALYAAHQLMQNLPPSLIQQDNTLQGFIPIPYYVKARFGLWQDILKEPKPNPKYQYAVAMWHYAQGMAYAHTGKIKQAIHEATALKNIIEKKPDTVRNFLGEKGLDLIKIANQVLEATIANTQGNESSTIDHLLKAKQIQFDMGYHEPPDWYFPMSEALGDVYLQYGHPKEAIAMYQENLKQYPMNGWALYGMALSYRMLGNNAEAEKLKKEFKKSWQYSDISKPILLFHKYNP